MRTRPDTKSGTRLHVAAATLAAAGIILLHWRVMSSTGDPLGLYVYHRKDPYLYGLSFTDVLLIFASIHWIWCLILLPLIGELNFRPCRIALLVVFPTFGFALFMLALESWDFRWKVIDILGEDYKRNVNRLRLAPPTADPLLDETRWLRWQTGHIRDAMEEASDE